MRAVGRASSRCQDPVSAGVEGIIRAGARLAPLAGDPGRPGRHTGDVGQGGVVLGDHGAHGVGPVTIIVTGSAGTTDIGGVPPASRGGGVTGAGELIHQRRVVPLHTGVDVGHFNARTPHAQCPHLVGFSVGDAPGGGSLRRAPLRVTKIVDAAISDKGIRDLKDLLQA